MADYKPWSVTDLLKAHAYLTDTLIGESGQFRSVGVAVVSSAGVPLHKGSPDGIGRRDRWIAALSSALCSMPLRIRCMYKYIDVATETVADVGVNVGVNVGVTDQILALLGREPHLSAKELATLLNKTSRTVERHLKMLREQGRLNRVGSDKTGYWEVIE